MPEERHTTSERVDDLPLIVYWLLKMQVAEIIDAVLPKPHGNRQGLSYGQLAVLFLTYILTQYDHRMCSVEEWVRAHPQTLEEATGWAIGDKDATDDRLEDLLSALGAVGDLETCPPAARIEEQLGRHVIRAYALPTQLARIDTTSFSVYHSAGEGETESSLVQFGHSKEHRPDLRQFIEALGTLDPAGIPLVSATLSGNTADDGVYLPLWKRMAAQVGRPDFLLVGDCKLASLENRARLQREGGFYLCPLPMTGNWPQILRDWVGDQTVPPQPVFLDEADSEPIGEGFTVELGKLWTDPATGQRVCWMEQLFVFRSQALAHRELQALNRRLCRAEQALQRLANRPGDDRVKLEGKIEETLHRHTVAAFLEVTVNEKRWVEERLIGPGRPGPDRPRRQVEHRRLTVTLRRRPQAIGEAEALAGWRIYATNAGRQRLNLVGAIRHYRAQWQPERGFHRFKRGRLSALPLYLQDDARIRGLMLLLGIALRVLTLMEFVVRRSLQVQNEELAGLYDGNPRRATSRPTAEKLLSAFQGITLYRHHREAHIEEEITPLSPLQVRILELMEVAQTIYHAEPEPVPRWLIPPDP
ncbi:MAG: transposase [Anaerolineae bacterium]